MAQSASWRLIWLAMLAAPLSGAGTDIYVPSLPDIQGYFSISEGMAKSTVPVYLAGYALAQMPVGLLADRHGRRRPLLAGLLLFVGASVMAATATDFVVLQIARFLQGLTVAAPAVLSRAAVTDAFEGQERLRALNTISNAWTAGPIIAPAVGAWLHAAWGWRAPLMFLAIYAAALFVGCVFAWPETLRSSDRPPILQAIRQLLATVSFRHAVVSLMMIFSVVSVFNVSGPFIVESELRYSVLAYGHLALFLGAMLFAGNTVNGWLIERYPPPRILFASAALMVAAAGAMVAVASGGASSLLTLALPTAIIYFAGGMFFPLQMHRAMTAQPRYAGSASALVGTLFVLGGVVASIGASSITSRSLLPLASIDLALAVGMLAVNTGRGAAA